MNINFPALKDYFFHAFRFCPLGYNHPFSAQWDRQLERILKNGELISTSTHIAKFSLDGDVFDIWISNRWYAYATLHQLNGNTIPTRLEARPRFRTMRQLHSLMCVFADLPDSRKDFYSRFESDIKARD
ncbi:hypothetical protein ACJK9F_004269 [Lelliottia nimipressuralis]|uniref:hypothetical protein n=1 Tax=Lelliottia nimipressuralis TaxID=69220 RepID=UPI0039067EAF